MNLLTAILLIALAYIIGRFQDKILAALNAVKLILKKDGVAKAVQVTAASVGTTK